MPPGLGEHENGPGNLAAAGHPRRQIPGPKTTQSTSHRGSTHPPAEILDRLPRRPHNASLCTDLAAASPALAVAGDTQVCSASNGGTMVNGVCVLPALNVGQTLRSS
jgi:hypothetical protein